MDLIDVQDRRLLQKPVKAVARILKDLLEFLGTCRGGVDFHEVSVQFPGDDPGERGLARAARTEENSRFKGFVHD